MKKSILYSGFNGFKHINSRQNIIKQFTDINFIGHFTDLLPLWSYLVIVGEESTIHVLGSNSSRKEISFDEPVVQVVGNERFLVVLLKSGILYKIVLKSFDVVQLRTDEICNRSQNEKLTFLAGNRIGFYGISNQNSVYAFPSLIFKSFPENSCVKEFAAGFEHFMVLLTSGNIYVWGSGLKGQLGTDSVEFEESPTLLDALAGIRIRSIAAGGWHSAAVSEFGDLYTWGWNIKGQLGLSTSNNKNIFAIPEIVEFETEIEKVYCGDQHTIVQTKSGDFYGTGLSQFGQLGDIKTEFVDHFTKLDIPKASSSLSVFCGPWATAVLVDDNNCQS